MGTFPTGDYIDGFGLLRIREEAEITGYQLMDMNNGKTLKKIYKTKEEAIKDINKIKPKKDENKG